MEEEVVVQDVFECAFQQTRLNVCCCSENCTWTLSRLGHLA